ncbi:MAG: transcription antitermination factor NusB [Treponema sp.]|jgi:N utilization substance protein B|nr:transcription antitermination factor NusB [Treponema sp.]
MASRRKGRILAFQALYWWESSVEIAVKGAKAPPGVSSKAPPGSPLSAETSNKMLVEELLNFSWLEADKRGAVNQEIADFSRLLIAGTIENIGAVDRMIQSHLQNWHISRLNRVDLAILRMSAYTLMFQRELPPSIVINEAIGISKEFGADESYRFINGVLDSIRRTLESSEAAPDSAAAEVPRTPGSVVPKEPCPSQS